MKTIAEHIKNLQEKPEYIKTRIIVGSGVVAAVIVVAVWFSGLKNQLANISGSSISDLAGTTTQSSAQHYVKIENSEDKDSQTYVYFSINNDTSDILNASQPGDITLTAGGTRYQAKQLTDRQGGPFAKKILSHSQSFGIAVFDRLPKTAAELTFDNMYFEQAPEKIFKETVSQDLSKLTPPDKIRN